MNARKVLAILITLLLQISLPFALHGHSMPIFLYPGDPLLTMSADEVNVEDISSEEIQSLIDRMLHLSDDNQQDTGFGIMVGLAAPQIGVMKQVILVSSDVDDEGNNQGHMIPFINPKIVWYSDNINWGPEGCYSVDEHLDGKIPRSESIRITAYDRHGNHIDQVFSGFIARILQHEVDHLHGIRFPDRVTEDGTLHWVPDDEYRNYLQTWEHWPLIAPWQLWLDMKEGREFEIPAFLACQRPTDS